MSELDEVSMHIGQLTGQMESLNENFERMITWMKESHTEVKLALDVHNANDKIQFDELKTKVEALDGFRNKIIAVCSVCSALFTAGGSFIYHHFFDKTGTNGF